MRRAFIFAIALAIPTLSAAQSTDPDAVIDVRSEARGHFGPFYLTPRVLLKELGVDSNVFNESGERKSDFTMTLAQKLDVWVPMARRALLKTTLNPDLVWYARYDSERSINPQFTARGEVYLNRITVFAENAFLNTRERPNYEVDLRSRRQEDALTAGVALALTPKFSIEVSARRNDLRYDADAQFDGTSLRRALDRESRGVQVAARHRVTPLTTIVMRYDRLRDRFAFSPVRNSDSYRILPGVEFAPQALLKGSAYVGYRRFTPSSPEALPEFGGLVGELGLTYTLLTTTLGVSYKRDLTYSYSELQPFFVDNSIGVSLRQALGGRFDVLATGDRHDYDYRSVLTAGADLVPRADIIWNYAVSLGYRVGRDGRLGIGAAYLRRDSTIPWRAYDNLRFVTSFSYGF